jgi:hypothetical protein
MRPFGRNCGLEQHPVVLVEEGGERHVLPREIDETPLDDPDTGEKSGYLMPEPENDESFSFTDAPEDYPEEWVDTARNGALRLRSDRRPYAAQELTIGRHHRHDWTPNAASSFPTTIRVSMMQAGRNGHNDNGPGS